MSPAPIRRRRNAGKSAWNRNRRAKRWRRRTRTRTVEPVNLDVVGPRPRFQSGVPIDKLPPTISSSGSMAFADLEASPPAADDGAQRVPVVFGQPVLLSDALRQGVVAHRGVGAGRANHRPRRRSDSKRVEKANAGLRGPTSSRRSRSGSRSRRRKSRCSSYADSRWRFRSLVVPQSLRVR